MLNEASNRQRFDKLVKGLCEEIGLADQTDEIQTGGPFGADGLECRLELNTSLDDRRAYVFACAGFPRSQVACRLVNDITSLADGQCARVRPEADSAVYAVVPFAVVDTDLSALKAHLMTALNSALALQHEAEEDA